MKESGGVIPHEEISNSIYLAANNRRHITSESKVITSEGTSTSSFPFNFIGGFPKQFLLGQTSNCGGMPEERKSVDALSDVGDRSLHMVV